MAQEEVTFDSVEACLEDIRAGKFVVIVDDAQRENEGDLIMAAERVTPEAVNFCIREARGLLCAPCDGALLDRLGIALAPSVNRGDAFATAFTLSVDGAPHTGVTTGISAGDRAKAVRLLVAEGTTAADFVSPGHSFPLRAVPGGVLRRAGHTEATVDLARLAGLKPAGICCEIVGEDGTMARLPDLVPFARKHGLKICSVERLIAYRREHETLVERVESVECLTGDVFGSARCDCGWQLHQAMTKIAEEGRGCLLYMRQEGRGIGLANKLHAYRLQEQGCDTVEANVRLGFAPDLRDYGIGAQILAALGIRRLRLMTNNPQKVVGLAGHGLEIVERVPLVAHAGPFNAHYLETKRDKMGHLL